MTENPCGCAEGECAFPTKERCRDLEQRSAAQQDRCRTCGGTGQMPARPGESRATSWPAAVPGAEAGALTLDEPAAAVLRDIILIRFEDGGTLDRILSAGDIALIAIRAANAALLSRLSPSPTSGDLIQRAREAAAQVAEASRMPAVAEATRAGRTVVVAAVQAALRALQSPAPQGGGQGERRPDGPGLSLRALHAANIARQAEWCPDQVPDLSFRGNELGGECGEAQNVIKKLERERHGWRGSRATKDDLAQELADLVICADLCAITAGIDLDAAVVAKFNATSQKQGLATMLCVSQPTPEAASPVDGANSGGEAAGGWRPIETAPQDGSFIWVFDGRRSPEAQQFICWWHTGRSDECYWRDNADSEPDPTHWRPLSASPRPSYQEGQDDA